MRYEQNLQNIKEMLAKRQHERHNGPDRGIYQQIWKDVHQSIRDRWINWQTESAKDMLKEQEMEVRYLMGSLGKSETQINTYLVKRGLIPDPAQEGLQNA